MLKKVTKKITVFVSLFFLLVNSLLPYVVVPKVFAQETSSPSAQPLETISPTPEPVWDILNLVLGKEYVAPQNDKVKIKFTKLPDSSGKLNIKEVKLTADQVKVTGALSDTAYDITSSMTDGTFAYNLTLPIPAEAKNKTIEVKSSEDINQIADAKKVTEPEEKTADSITIHDLNHFTVFILTTPAPDVSRSILINEVLPNPSAGNEWVELYNNTDSAINLADGSGWTIKNSVNTTLNLALLGTISTRGRIVFEQAPEWLSNNAPETVTLLDQNGVEIDKVTISTASPGIEVDHYPATSESVGRRPDGSANWVIFTSPTKGGSNNSPDAKAVSETVNADNGYPDWYQDDNGVRVVQDPALPALASGTFPSEFFWWSAEALMNTPGGGAKLIMAAEGAFANDAVVAEDQITFGRLRIRADGLTPNTDYTITHPYGSVVIRTDGTGELRSDGDDIGCAGNPCVFSDALGSPVFQSFLRWDTNAPAGYLGDGITSHTVTGSPNGNNFFRIEGPGLPGGKIETNQFAVLGKLFAAPVVPPPGCIDIAPDAPTLVSPTNGAIDIAISPTLTWNTISSFGTNCLGNNNQFEIFLDSGNVDPTTSWGNVSEATLSKLILGLPDNTTHSWKIRAKNGALSADSEIRTFTTVAAAASNRAVSTFFRSDGYPTWYRDDNDITVEPCLDGADPFCTFLPPFGEEPQWDPGQPTIFPTNFPSEFFYWAGEAAIESGGVSALLILAAEGAFLNENPAPGDQMVFGRIRVRGDGFQPNTEYTVTHPYGQDTYTTNEFGALRPSPNTEDIGCVASLCDFSQALGSRVFGGFLRQPTAPDGYLGDGVNFLPVIGSPLNQNFFRIEGPGLPEGGLQTNLFVVTGKVLVPVPPPPGCEDSAPDQPSLINPVNGAVGVSTNSLINWQDLASFGNNCVGQRDIFEVFVDQGNVDPTTSRGTVLGTQTSFTVLNLLPNTTYSLKVRASNGVLGTDSEVRTFTTTGATANRALSTTLGADNGFPDWYRDDLGVLVAPCLDGTDANCVLPAAGEEPGFDPSQPSILPGNFPTEFFYWIAESNPLATPGGGDVDIRYAVEGAFLSPDPSVDNQLVFGRIRVRATGLLPNEIYTVTHAYGVDAYQSDENGNIPSTAGTEDIGCDAVPCDFVSPLVSRVFGGFLKVTNGAPEGYLGDGATLSTVTGSPLGQNFFRVEGPGLPAGGLETNLFTVSGKVFVPPVDHDVTAPVITRLGADPVNVTAGDPYIDAGATALDNIDGDITANIITVNPVNTAVIGTYTVTYNVSDAAGNPAVEVTRTVNVVAPPDLDAPILQSFSSTTIDGTYGPGSSINITTTFDEPLGAGSNATVVLNTIPTELIALSLVSINTLSGTYVVGATGSNQNTTDLTVASISAMNVTDVTGNLQSATTLPTNNIADTSNIVVDTIAPVITLLGVSPENVVQDTVYTDSGATALDNVDGDLTANIVTVNPVDISVIGTYTVTYNVSDAAGNLAVEVTRTVNVITPPNVTPPTTTDNIDGNWHNSAVTITLTCTPATGATCANTYYTTDGSDPTTLSSIGTTFTLTADGIYTVKYFSVDNSGNQESIKTALNQVKIDTQAPNVTGLTNDNVPTSTKTWEWGSSEAGAQFRYLIDQSIDGVPTGAYSNVTIATQNTDTGIFYIHVQAKDFAGNEGQVVTASAILGTGTGKIIIAKRTNPLSSTVNFTFTGDIWGSITGNGEFTIINLPPGIYNSTETDPSPSFDLSRIFCNDTNSTWDIQTRTARINLQPGETVKCTFTNTKRGSISGTKFNDVNGNGRKDVSEAGISGWTIYLDNNNNQQLDPGEASTITDASGRYVLSYLTPRTYIVREVQSFGWLQTRPRLGYYRVSVRAGSSVTGKDFGNIQI